MPTYSITDLQDKVFYARGKVVAYSYMGGKPINTFNDGQMIGVMYSWARDKKGNIWFQFKPNQSKAYSEWIKYDPNKPFARFQDFKQQGVKTVNEKKKEEERKNESFADIGKKILRAAPFVMGGLGLAWLLINSRNNARL